jgi:hypothetical protein
VIKQGAVLKPLDIVTTAGSAGNIIAALNFTRNTDVGEDGRLSSAVERPMKLRHLLTEFGLLSPTMQL